MKNRRMRMFAGPNGSGKSTINFKIRKEYDAGIYVNADDIEKAIFSDHGIQLNDFGISEISESEFLDYCNSHSLIEKAKERGFTIGFSFSDKNTIHPTGKINSYQAALVADFIRSKLIDKGVKFSFETVMSDQSKIDILKKTRENGYKNYLYYICTEDSRINCDRVNQRVEKGGHPVPESLIISRYERSLSHLRSAVSQTYRSFIYDNSGKEAELILEVFEGKTVTPYSDRIPNWVQKHLLR
ncbi:MAG: zeta toxin family protein [Flavobacteriales bacterium]|nr:zeta toxin family protein [Flavobacteriales bacterium]